MPKTDGARRTTRRPRRGGEIARAEKEPRKISLSPSAVLSSCARDRCAPSSRHACLFLVWMWVEYVSQCDSENACAATRLCSIPQYDFCRVLPSPGRPAGREDGESLLSIRCARVRILNTLASVDRCIGMVIRRACVPPAGQGCAGSPSGRRPASHCFHARRRVTPLYLQVKLGREGYPGCRSLCCIYKLYP